MRASSKYELSRPLTVIHLFILFTQIIHNKKEPPLQQRIILTPKSQVFILLPPFPLCCTFSLIAPKKCEGDFEVMGHKLLEKAGEA